MALLFPKLPTRSRSRQPERPITERAIESSAVSDDSVHPPTLATPQGERRPLNLRQGRPTLPENPVDCAVQKQLRAAVESRQPAKGRVTIARAHLRPSLCELSTGVQINFLCRTSPGPPHKHGEER